MTDRNRLSRDERERLDELLATEATEGLAGEEALELQAMLLRSDDERDGMALAAAAADRLWAGEPAESLPDHLRSRILASARETLSTRAAGSEAMSAPPPVLRGPGSVRVGNGTGAPFAWLVAAAAVVLATVGWWREPTSDVRDPAAARAELVASATDLVRVDWAPLDDPRFAGVSGDVVWSNSAQRGYMRLAGIPVNDPAREQYQLWIVDPARDERPVDGGVFDFVADGDEQVIPIDAKLTILDPTVFALTLEQPGGVVVSDGPLLTAASVSG